MSIKNNTTSLQTLLEAVNALPELPILIDEGSASELLSGKQLINQEGNIITGTFSLDNELSAQDDLIAQIQAAVDELPEAGSRELSLQSKTVTPNKSSQTVSADSGYDGLDIVTVNPIPNMYVNPGIFISDKTYTPTTSDQTIIHPNTFCTGYQIIKGDANLIPENIVSGKSIFGVIGNAESGSGDNTESGSGGNTGINDQTCTVTFDNEAVSNDCPVVGLVATILENGVRKTYMYNKSYNDESNYKISLSNVVCGTKIYLIANIYQVFTYEVSVEVDGSAIYESYSILDRYCRTLLTFTAPTTANENCTIYYAYNP